MVFPLASCRGFTQHGSGRGKTACDLPDPSSVGGFETRAAGGRPLLPGPEKIAQPQPPTASCFSGWQGQYARDQKDGFGIFKWAPAS